jgi:hypothetical protein
MIEFGRIASSLHQFPNRFTVPRRFEKHMIVLAGLANSDAEAIEDALTSAWRLQARESPPF